MLEKSEWPTDAKLRRLREEGVVALSSFACRCAAALGFLLTLWLMRKNFAELGSDFRMLLAGQGALEGHAAHAARLVAMLVLAPAGAGAFCALACGLLQTRFLFRFRLVSPNMSRLNPFRFPDMLSLLLRPFAAVGLAVIFLLLGLISVRLGWSGLFYILNNERGYLAAWAPGMVEAVLPPVLALLGMLAVLGWLGNKFLFLAAQRMTRQELERELREVTDDERI